MATILMMAGGTGGHIFPALAVAKQLAENGHTIHWLGSTHGLENKLIPPTGFPLHCLTISGMRKTGWKKKLMLPFVLIRALSSALFLLRKIKPEVVIGFGGFASAPGGVAAKLLNIPLIIHEQNAVAGLTNRLQAHFANRVLSAYPNVFPKNKNSQVVGNPIRTEFTHILAPVCKENREQFNITIIGGSQGATVFNTELPEIFSEIIKTIPLTIFHQAGKNQAESTQARYEAQKIKATVTEFIEDMVNRLKETDLLICRAGALTVAEITAAGVAALFIPYPFAVDDHQTENTKYLREHAACYFLKQSDLNLEKLMPLLTDLYDHPEKINQTAKNAYALRRIDATETICQICKELLHVPSHSTH